MLSLFDTENVTKEKIVIDVKNLQEKTIADYNLQKRSWSGLKIVALGRFIWRKFYLWKVFFILRTIQNLIFSKFKKAHVVKF